MKKGKKTIRLTESEMVSLIENIVKQVKNEKKREITESRGSRKPISRTPSRKSEILKERHQRLILESEGEMILADLETMDEENPDPILEKLKGHLEILERKGGRALSDFKRKLNSFKGKLGKASKFWNKKFTSFFKKIKYSIR